MRVLVVEDSTNMRDVLVRGLTEAGHAVDAAPDGPAGLARAVSGSYDAVVLDVMLPGMDGFAVCRDLRDRQVWTPVLMLTARDAVPDRVNGLDSGADDYLVKPFAFTELLGRLRALQRRGAPPRPAVLRCGPLSLDPAARLVQCRGETVELSRREFALLEFLLRHPGHVLSRAQILEQVWGLDYDGLSNVVDVYVKYLRDKIDRRFSVDLVQTVRGAGYRIACVPPAG
ncbi:response regulator transcription factor [Blastococcus tunisiensis]|uniref:DNA-binding response regulator, OmpR family, contains REC and winged-helix (WHTH) domain n=1 Tax=Blastococcus tunisiensis TaxID=1798228 RepID=A0A1I2EW04_9ACTN|nr:response regulator transcription factor [Blastococcus sp. DSM 46838]SFE96638.1 DNA-binding response regulator, OmpR family, contains REC and winged-helix (wHTH) domain [Blastococcus sp. DSM 46838]